MIYTGYIGQFYEVTNLTPFWIWGAISTVFYIYILAVVWRILGKESTLMLKSPDNLQAAMKNLRWYILITWTLYPIAYIMPAMNVRNDKESCKQLKLLLEKAVRVLH